MYIYTYELKLLFEHDFIIITIKPHYPDMRGIKRHKILKRKYSKIFHIFEIILIFVWFDTNLLSSIFLISKRIKNPFKTSEILISF